jgi:competence protein ComEC
MRILTRRKLFSFALFMGGGMAMARLFSPNPIVLAAAAVGLAGIALSFYARRTARRFFAGTAVILFFSSVFFAGAGYYAAREAARPTFETAYDVRFAGTIAGSPYLDEGGERFVCALKDVSIEGEAIGYRIRLYLRGDAEQLNKIACGQEITGVGHLHAPGAATNPHEFDFGEFLWRANLAGYVTAKAGDAAISGDGGGLSNLLYTVRKAISARVDTAFPKNPEIVMALALGDTRDIDADLRADFSRSGVAHLLAVSGLHITLIAAALTLILARFTGARAAAYLSLLGIIVYAAIVGFWPSVMRAVLMYAVLCGAPLAGRMSDGSTRLALAFSVILLINPLSFGDAGFALSFSASAGIIWISPPLLKLVRADRLREKRGIRNRIGYYFASLAVSTTAAQLATFPVLALFYGKMPVYSIAANLILVPYTLLMMYASLLGIAFPAFAFVPDHMLTLLRQGVAFFANLPHGEIPVKPPHALVWLLFLALGIAVSDMGPLRERWKPWAVLALPILVAASFVYGFDPGGCLIEFLDVGQADAAVIRVDGRTYVVDVGEDGSKVANYIAGEGWDIDGVFLSHPHSDHAGGLGELAEACEIGAVYVPAGWFDLADSESIVLESKAIADAGVRWIELSPGDEVELSKRATMTVLDPGSATGDALNDTSLVLLLGYGDADALFTGDAEVEAGPDIDVLKVAHHGSKDATDRKLVEALMPEVAVISVGKDNPYGHPDGRVIELIEETGGKVYRTDESGAVHMDGDGVISVDTFIKEGGE